ncbi:MAG: hypothetical protein IKZ39_03480 [Lachnospiraceae bacterium]|nr:hypothetical protein [Lachnospiraceae bacterium]
MKIGPHILRAVKISVAAIAAILIAELLNLQFSVSAGIVAVLSVAFTKKETLQTAWSRLLAFAIALGIAAVCFNLIGYDNIGFFVYLAVFIVICQFMGWHSAMAMDSVLISHFLLLKNMGVGALANEAGLFVIGVSAGIVANIFLHKNSDFMVKMKQETDDLMKRALHRMSLRIMNPAMEGYDGSCFENLSKTLDDAAALARLNYMNSLSKEETEDIEYIAMRESQSDTLYEMFKHLSKIETVPVTAGLLSEFFEKVSQQYSMDNTVEELLKNFAKLDAQMKEMPLPTERSEFEDRARLFAVMRGLEEFLKIKKEYMERK